MLLVTEKLNIQAKRKGIKLVKFLIIQPRNETYVESEIVYVFVEYVDEGAEQLLLCLTGFSTVESISPIFWSISQNRDTSSIQPGQESPDGTSGFPKRKYASSRGSSIGSVRPIPTMGYLTNAPCSRACGS